MARDETQMQHLRLRLPTNIKRWVESEAARNAATLNSEVIRALVERRDRVIAQRVALASDEQKAAMEARA